MFLRTLAFTALAVETVSAFRDASPFFMLSTSELVPRYQSVTSRAANSWSSPASSDSTHSRVDTVATSSSVQDYVQDALAGCQSDTYILVNQPAVSAADFSTTTHATIHLRQRMTGGDQGVKTRKTVSNVLGRVALGAIERSLVDRCGATSLVLDGTAPKLPKVEALNQVITIQFGALPVKADSRIAALAQNDYYLNELIASLPSAKYTVIYTTTPVGSEEQREMELAEQQYLMDEPYPSGFHTDLKRDLSAYPLASNSSNLNSNLGLFEKYQFFSSGIFMGVSVSLLLLSILYVGLSAISGLEVTYMAFSKEMGPAAQRKAQ